LINESRECEAEMLTTRSQRSVLSGLEKLRRASYNFLTLSNSETEIGRSRLRSAVAYLLDPLGTHLIPIHHSENMVEWWYTWRKVSWFSFFRKMKKKVSQNSISLEK
jgi:hypothetical protein